MKQRDVAGKKYWDNNWASNDIPELFDINDKSMNNKVNLEFHRYFKTILEDRVSSNFLEIGCANSIWPVYFYQNYGLKVDGLDYSEIGCNKSRYLFDKYKICGQVHHADMFTPPLELKNKYDIVASFGVAEHFENTSGCLKSMSNFISDNGIMITVIPNMIGILGWFQKKLNKSIYDIHVLLDRENLVKAHIDAGLEIIDKKYFLPINLCVLHSNFDSTIVNNLFRRAISAVSKAIWWIDSNIVTIPVTRFMSPYIIVVSKVKKTN